MIAVPEPAPYREASPQRVAAFMAGLYIAVGYTMQARGRIEHLFTMLATAARAAKETR